MSDCREFILKVEVKKTRTINQEWIKKILLHLGFWADAMVIYEYDAAGDPWMQFDIEDIETYGDLMDTERELVGAIKMKASKAVVKTKRFGYRCEWVEI